MYYAFPIRILLILLLSLIILILLPLALLFLLIFLPLHLIFSPFADQAPPLTRQQQVAARVYPIGKVLLAPLWFPLFAATSLCLILSLWIRQLWTGKP